MFVSTFRESKNLDGYARSRVKFASFLIDSNSNNNLF